MKRLILLDIHAIVHRAYHALPPTLTTPAGEASNAVYGFTSILLRILKELKPRYIAAAFDLPGPTFRHAAYEQYKAQRPETPADLESQFAKVREVVEAFGIPIYEKEGYEADDLIGTLIEKLHKNRDLEIVVVTGDLDALQLLRPRVKVYAMKKGITETVIYDARAMRERYGLTPSQWADFKGLKGDPSDNIPGVKGVGEKTAVELLERFGSIEGIYQVLKRGSRAIGPTLAEKLRTQEEQAIFSKKLATIQTHIPIVVKLPELIVGNYQARPAVSATLGKFGFVSLLRRLAAHPDSLSAARAAKPGMGVQVSLLDVPHAAEVVLPIVRSPAEFKTFVRSAGRKQIGLIFSNQTLYLVRERDRKAVECRPEVWIGVRKDATAAGFFQKPRLVYDGKSLIHFLRLQGIHSHPPAGDILLAAYVANATARDFSYPAIAARELGVGEVLKSFSRFFDCAAALDRKLEAGLLRSVYEKIELPLVPVLVRMEERGVRLDPAYLKNLATTLDRKLANLTRKIHALAGETFNINSPPQLSHILFVKLQIQARGLRRTPKGGVISTGATELEKLRSAHPVIPKILEYRELAKLKNTYVDVLPTLVNSETGRIHTTYSQVGTATGRLSSSDPNLQNIPILSEFGREIRKAFVADPGFLLVSFDYSQIELRVAAHLADDKKMIEAFRHGTDIHRLTAAAIYDVPMEKVTPALRRAAKTLNFGVLYGMGPVAFAESTGLSRTEAKKFIDEYFREFSGICDFVEQTKRMAEEQGYVQTLYGRRRYIPEIHSPNWQLRREAERMAVNMPIQGTATGDIVKMAMIRIAEWIGKERLEDTVRLLLQVHDELLFEIKEGMVKQAVPKIRTLMEGVVKLKVPLEVETYTGKTWGKP